MYQMYENSLSTNIDRNGRSMPTNPESDAGGTGEVADLI
jgi:hypothetical protein